MPYIDSTKFGEIVIDGKKYHQVLIIGNSVIERNYERLEKLFETSHKIGDWEIEELLKEDPEIIIIGTGQDGMMEIDRDFSEKIEDKNIELVITATPEIIKVYNEKIEAGKRTNALIHTTC